MARPAAPAAQRLRSSPRRGGRTLALHVKPLPIASGAPPRALGGTPQFRFCLRGLPSRSAYPAKAYLSNPAERRDSQADGRRPHARLRRLDAMVLSGSGFQQGYSGSGLLPNPAVNAPRPYGQIALPTRMPDGVPLRLP